VAMWVGDGRDAESSSADKSKRTPYSTAMERAGVTRIVQVEKDARKRSSRGLPYSPSAHGRATRELGSKVRCREVVKVRATGDAVRLACRGGQQD
jgi:hypothetical protein